MSDILSDTCIDAANVDIETSDEDEDFGILKIVKQVLEALAALRPQFIYMPKNIGESRKIQQKFFNIAKFPSCIGAMDCTHIKI